MRLINNISLDQLLQHKCYYYLFQNKNKFTNVSTFLSKELMMNRIRVAEQYRVCSDLFQSLTESQVPFAVFKGAPLSISVYSDTGYRSSGDIDILIHRSNLKNIDKILESCGFIQGKLIDNTIVEVSRDEKIFHLANTHQTVPYIKPTNSKVVPFVNVDVNMSITWRECPEIIDMNEFLEQPEYINVISGISVPVLDTEKHFISICLHSYKDMNSPYLLYSRNGFPLSCLSDIHYLMKNGQIKVKRLYDIASKYSIVKYIYYCVYHSARLFGNIDNDELISIFSQNSNDEDLWKFGLKDRAVWGCDWLDLLLSNHISVFLKNNMTSDAFDKMMLNIQYMS